MTHALRVIRDEEARSTARNKPWWAIRMIERARTFIGRICTRLAIPGIVKNFEFEDRMTGNKIEFIVTARATTLRINDRDYSFGRFSGRFMGTGTSISRLSDSEVVEGRASAPPRTPTDSTFLRS